MYESQEAKTTSTLNRAQLTQGREEGLCNAKRLIEDAKLLGQHERYRLAYMALLLASEEMGRAIWLQIGLGASEHYYKLWSKAILPSR
jgi:AbiV family abortive infection protein